MINLGTSVPGLWTISVCQPASNLTVPGSPVQPGIVRAMNTSPTAGRNQWRHISTCYQLFLPACRGRSSGGNCWCDMDPPRLHVAAVRMGMRGYGRWDTSGTQSFSYRSIDGPQVEARYTTPLSHICQFVPTPNHHGSGQPPVEQHGLMSVALKSTENVHTGGPTRRAPPRRAAQESDQSDSRKSSPAQVRPPQRRAASRGGWALGMELH